MNRVALDQHGLSPIDHQVCRVMGIAPSAMAEQKARRQGTSAHAAGPQTQTVRMNNRLTPQAYADSLKRDAARPGPGNPDLTAQEREVCMRMGLDPYKFAEWKRRNRGIPSDGQRA